MRFTKEIAELEKMWGEFNFVHFENGRLNNQFYNWIKGTQITNIIDGFNSKIPDVFYDNKFSVDLLVILWEELGNIPINNNDEIEEEFYCWKKGTFCFEIWHWFDEKLPNGLVEDFNVNA